MNPDLQQQINALKAQIETLAGDYYANNFSASQDFAKFSRFKTRLRLPIYATAPTKCELGEVYVNSGTGKAYVCSAANTWSLIGTQS